MRNTQYTHITLSADEYEKFDQRIWDTLRESSAIESGYNPVTYFSFPDGSFVAFDDTLSNKRISIHSKLDDTNNYRLSAFRIHKAEESKTMNIQQLQQQAEQSTEWRNHTLIWVTERHNYAFGQCIICRKSVTCRTNPLPNQIDIGGEAIAINCTNPKTRNMQILYVFSGSTGKLTEITVYYAGDSWALPLADFPIDKLLRIIRTTSICTVRYFTPFQTQDGQTLDFTCAHIYDIQF